MITAFPRGTSATLVALVCLTGAFGAGLLAWGASDRPEIDRAWVVVTAALISALTGALVAVAMTLFRRSPRSARAAPTSPAVPSSGYAMSPRPESRHPAERRSPHAVVVNQVPAPMQATAQLRATPAPRHAVALPVTAAELPTSPIPLLGGPTVPPPDPRAAGLRTEHRALLAQRASLLRGLADLVDRLPEGFDWQVAKLMEEAGARKLTPEPGTAFDPVSQSVLGTEPTPDAGVHDTVARMLRAGWLDRDQVLVPANVVLYALSERPEGGPDDDQQ